MEADPALLSPVLKDDDARVSATAASVVREDFIPREDYISRDVAAREKERLWPRVWQMACREEELARPGSFTTYDVAGQSILIVRTADGALKAFHNVCPHRGNQLAAGSGSLAQISCSFRGWRWTLEGRSSYVKDEADFAGCTAMGGDDLSLTPVRLDSWAGFVFINMDPDAEPFRDFLAPVPHYLDCVAFEGMRIAWHQTIRLAGNWKTALESFMESYHVYTTHPQLVPVFDEQSFSRDFGKHGMHGYPPTNRPLGAPSLRTGMEVPSDLREGVIKVFADIADQTGGATGVGNISGRAAKEVERLRTEVPADATAAQVLTAAFTFMAEAAIRDGAIWPTITAEQMADLGVDWNIFPNMVLVFGLDSSLVFRARPDGDDPDRCLFDMWGLLRTSDANAPQWDHRRFDNWRDHVDEIPSLLVQDLRNIERIQRGMHSIAFKGSRTNPVQERQIFSLHRALHDYIDP